MHRGLVSGGLGLLLLVGCGVQSTCSPPPSSKVSCADASAPHHAYVVVEHLSGSWIQACVGFAEVSIDGQKIMDGSGVEYQAQAVRSGKVMCQVDNEPTQYAECFPQNRPYWALFIESKGRWSSAPGGFADVHLGDRDALGWHYVQASDPAPSPPPMPREL